MTKPLLELKDVVLKVNRNTPEEIMILDHLNLTINAGDFITVLGSNGAGKSTLFNAIGGDLSIDSGQILLNGKDIAHESVEKRTRFLARVFQDPKLGTAPRMNVAENLLLAERRGQPRGLRPRHLNKQLDRYRELTATMHNGLDSRLTTATGNLSGGQRQALSFLMATLKRPELLLLDEHTAALDPKTSVSLMHLTNTFVQKDQLTALMITHHMEDALHYGNRLIVMKDGKIVKDLNQEEKKDMTIADYYQLFD